MSHHLISTTFDLELWHWPGRGLSRGPVLDLVGHKQFGAYTLDGDGRDERQLVFLVDK